MPIQHTVDIVALAQQESHLHVLLIQRAHSPFQDQWALPGGHVEEGESLSEAAVRELHEETGIRTTEDEVIQIGTFGHPKRDPRGHVLSTAYLLLLPELTSPSAQDDAKAAGWFKLTIVEPQMAFDHKFIVRVAKDMIIPVAPGMIMVDPNTLRHHTRIRQAELGGSSV